MSKRHTTTKEITRILDLLKIHVDQRSPNLCAYRGDWTDDKIAKEVAPDLNANHVARFRNDLYGALDKPARQRSDSEEIAFFKDALLDVSERFERLLDTLSLNKVADVRHLKAVPPE